MNFLKLVFGFSIMTYLPTAALMWLDGVDLLTILEVFSVFVILMALIFLFSKWVANKNW